MAEKKTTAKKPAAKKPAAKKATKPQIKFDGKTWDVIQRTPSNDLLIKHGNHAVIISINDVEPANKAAEDLING